MNLAPSPTAALALPIVMGFACASAAAQTPRFRVTPLVKLGFTPNADTDGTLGINNKGQVVYGYIPTGQSDKRAWLWLPATDYGFSTAGFKDLSALSSSSSDTPGIAREINESGLAVGEGGSAGASNRRAAVWALASGGVTHTQLGTLSGAANPWSGAHSINDQSPPVIVGDSATEDECLCSQGNEDDQTHGFRLVYNSGSSSTLVDLSPSPSVIGSARDVHTPGGGASLRIAGDANCPVPTEGICDSVQNPPCDGGDEAVVWQSDSRITLADFDGTSSNVKGSHGRGVNNAGESVGWARTDEDDPDCIQQALYWATPTSAYVNLGSLMPAGQSGDPCRAEAINNLSLPQVVGANLNELHALLWERTSTTWIATDLDSAAAVGGCGSAAWEIQEAHDINDNGWIIAWGVNEADDDEYALLLTPFPACPADVTADGCVNIDDILAVLSWFGSCPVGTICVWDVDGSCEVDEDDLDAVDEAWCPNPCDDPPGECCENCPQCESGFAGGGSSERPTLAQMIEYVMTYTPEPAQAGLIQWLIANW